MYISFEHVIKYFVCKVTNLLKTIPLKELEIGNLFRNLEDISRTLSRKFTLTLSQTFKAYLSYIIIKITLSNFYKHFMCQVSKLCKAIQLKN